MARTRARSGSFFIGGWYDAAAAFRGGISLAARRSPRRTGRLVWPPLPACVSSRIPKMPSQHAFVLPVSALAAFALGCASSGPPPKPPAAAQAPAAAEPSHEKTAADPALQQDVTKLIDQCEQRFSASGRVVDTYFERLEDQTVIESWIVTRGTNEVVYLVKLTPSPDGTEIGIQCPPKPRVK